MSGASTTIAQTIKAKQKAAEQAAWLIHYAVSGCQEAEEDGGRRTRRQDEVEEEEERREGKEQEGCN